MYTRTETAIWEALHDDRARSLLDGLGIKVWVADPDAVELCFVSGPMSDLLGIPAGQRPGVPLEQHVHPNHRAIVSAACREVARTTEPRSLEYRALSCNGHVCWLAGELRPLRDEAGTLRGVAAVLADVTGERKTAASWSPAGIAGIHGEALVDTLDGIVWEATPSFQFTFVSKQAERLLGYPVSRWIDEPTFWVTHLHPEDRDRCVQFCVEQTRRGLSHRIEYRMLTASGDVVWLRDYISVMTDGGRAVRLRGVMVDVTEQKRTQRELEKMISILRATLDSTADGILVVDRDGRIAARNQRFAEMWRLTDDPMPKDDLQALELVLDELLEPDAFLDRVRWLYTHPEEDGFDVVRFKDGRVFERYSRPQRLGDTVIGRVWSFRDVTEQRRAEEALRASEERYRYVYTHTPVMMHSIARNGTLMSVSNTWLEVLGYERAEVIGQKSVKFLTPESRRYAETVVLPAFFQTGVCRDVPYQFVKKNGDVIDVLLSGNAEWDESGKVRRSVAVLIDVTERKRAEAERDRLLVEEKAARRSAEQTLALLDTVLMTAPVALGFLDRELRYVRVNAVLAALHGRTPEEDVGRGLAESVPDLRARVEPIMRRVIETGEPATGVELVGEVPGHPGGPRSWLASYYPIRTASGELLGVGVVALDVTEQKAAEALQARLYHEAQEAIRVRDDFLAIASHELRTPLTPLAVYLQVIDRKLHAHEAVQLSTVEKALRQLNQLKVLINDLLDASRIADGRLALHLEQISMLDLVREQVASQQRISPLHRLELSEPDDALVVDGDRARLAQVVSNLLDNAVKYSPDGGAIQVRLARQQDEAVLSVTDPGIGIPKEQQPYLFDRFFRATNSPISRYGGLGLGLYISRDIVERHGGRISVESEPGRGSTFRVALPLQKAR